MLHPALSAIDCYRPDLLSEAPFWRGHLPFAGGVVAMLRPRRVVELGVQHGDSLFTFAEAARRYAPDAELIGIDAWEGDAHVGDQPCWIFHRVQDRARAFPKVRLVRARFDAAAAEIEDGAVDLLHIDGGHSEEDARTDLDTWLHKLAPEGIILMHDITAYCRGFGVWRVWQDMAAAHPHFAFAHSAGLGVLAPKGVPSTLSPLLNATLEQRLATAKTFAALGRQVLLAHSTPDQIARAERIGRLPLPPDIAPDPDLAAALDCARW